MNRKLPQKLQAKAAKVSELLTVNPVASALQLGIKAHQLIKGGYGNTINPFDKRRAYNEHKLFRQGFLESRKAVKLGIKIEA